MLSGHCIRLIRQATTINYRFQPVLTCFIHTCAPSLRFTFSSPRRSPFRTMSTDTTIPAAATATSSTTGTSKPSSEIYKGKARVYTKTGDKGMTSLFNMERRSKADDYFAALGDTDELNANLGVVRAHCTSEAGTNANVLSPTCIATHLQLDEQLSEIQSRLFDVGAHLATPIPASNAAQQHRTQFGEHHVDQLEAWIDEMEIDLPPLKNFILPSGGLVATHLHVARAVCRRAERATVPIVERGDSDVVVQKYLNRLSDYLFVAARYAALQSGSTETIWKKPREPRVKKTTATEEPSPDEA